MPRSDIKRKTDCKTNFWRLPSLFLLATSSQGKRAVCGWKTFALTFGQVERTADSERRPVVTCVGLLLPAEEASTRMFVNTQRKPESTIWWSEQKPPSLIVRRELIGHQSVVQEQEVTIVLEEWRINSKSSSSQRSAADAVGATQQHQVQLCWCWCFCVRVKQQQHQQLPTVQYCCTAMTTNAAQSWFGRMRQQEKQHQLLKCCSSCCWNKMLLQPRQKLICGSAV